MPFWPQFRQLFWVMPRRQPGLQLASGLGLADLVGQSKLADRQLRPPDGGASCGTANESEVIQKWNRNQKITLLTFTIRFNYSTIWTFNTTLSDNDNNFLAFFCKTITYNRLYQMAKSKWSNWFLTKFDLNSLEKVRTSCVCKKDGIILYLLRNFHSRISRAENYEVKTLETWVYVGVLMILSSCR